MPITGCIPAFSTRGKGALEPLLSAKADASKRETPTGTPNLTESTEMSVFEEGGKPEKKKKNHIGRRQTLSPLNK